MNIYIDMDGTLLHPEHDERFAASGYDVDWYNNQYCATLAINHNLVYKLRQYKATGHTLILWTNRGVEQLNMTMDNLGDLWYIFDDHRFYCGKKKGTNLNGYTYDNEPKYLEGTEGELISWYKPAKEV